jgi:hypothetical protein
LRARTTATILAIFGLVIASSAIIVNQYDYTHPVSPPRVESFRMAAFLSNEESSVLDWTNCSVTNPPPRGEQWIFGLPATVNIIIQNTGNTPVFISAMDMYNNYTGVTWTANVPLVYGTSYATISTGTIQIYGVSVPTSGWTTNGVVKLHFTAITSDGDTNSTSLLLKSIFKMGNSTTATFSTTNTTTTTSSASTHSCPISVAVP